MSIDVVQAPPEPVHLVALSGIHTLAGKIRYACEHVQPAPTPERVREWLARYHVTPHEAVVSTVVNAWRAEHALPALLDSETGTEQARNGHAAQPPVRREPPPGAKGFYLAAFLAMLVSVDTSWRFFGDVLHITHLWERLVMFTVLEVALLACGYGMRANVIRTGRPGSPRLIAWMLCGLAAYMAWQLSGFADGLARVALGPALGLVMLDLALGIERRAGQHKTGTWARVGRELRERWLSRLGLADDERDALARTRDRAARRVATLTLGGWVLFRRARVARALRASNISHDPAARDRMLAELAAIRHATDLADLDQPSPWQTEDPVHAAAPATTDSTEQVRPAREPSKPTRTARSRTAGRSRTRGRKLLADYTADAMAAWSPGVEVTPAWARKVSGCSAGLSVKVAAAVRDQLAATPATTTPDTTTAGPDAGTDGREEAP